MTRRWAPLVVTLTLAVLGVSALAAAAFVPTLNTPQSTPSLADAEPVATGTPSAAPVTTPSPWAGAAVDTSADAVGLAELVDPAWAARIARAGEIPERALVAYAGAAIEVAQTMPGCGLGWNTLAAIGYVETEHASMNGATLNADGTVTPPIIGIALDGNGTLPVPDTDGGIIDGDATWDRAVGPMQFIPATWLLAAQDGNRDGVRDINQIDDAVLATAMHLCEVGGDLTVPANWIAAIGAYNPSVDYNNHVADAANHYATLP